MFRIKLRLKVRNSGHSVDHWTVNRGNGDSIPTAAILKLRQFHSLTLPVSEEKLKSSGPFYLVSMSGELKDPTQGVNV